MSTDHTNTSVISTASFLSLDESFLLPILRAADSPFGVEHWAVTNGDPGTGAISLFPWHEDAVGEIPENGFTVTLQDLARAIHKILDLSQWLDFPEHGTPPNLFLQTELCAAVGQNDPSEVDARMADLIVQVAVLGSIVYV